jgi:cold shock CspA family protein
MNLANNALVSFLLGRNEKGICAVDIRLVGEMSTESGNATRRVGRIIEYYSDRPYAFVECPDGSRFFFHESHMTPDSDWDTLKNGAFVSFTFGQNKGGVCAVDVSLKVEGETRQ